MRFLTTLFALLLFLNLSAQDQTLVPFGSEWKYLDDGSNQFTDWRANAFDDSSWASGLAQLGYGSGDENTLVSFGPDPNNKYITTYFRHHFNIDDLSVFKNFLLKIKKDDGAIVYVNGKDVMRANFGKNIYNFDDEAYSSISSEEEEIIWEDFVSPVHFQEGENVIAVEVHQYTAESSDLIFDLELIGFDDDPALYRAPYLQKSTSDGITIKWKTDIPTSSKVWYGPSLNDLSSVVESADLKINHEINISGLEPDSDYFYKVGNDQVEFIGGTAEFFFTTNPGIGTAKPTRIWITGDAGTGKDEQKNVRNSYLNFIGASGKSDLWLMMGDNAYEHGREADYHMGLFQVYPEILRNTVSFPTTGNHDLLAEASAISEVGTFYDIFALPTEGESGGLASGKESYYSLDYGNIHIVCLESTDLDRGPNGPMANWLREDLQQTNADWLIAFWHFAPYTKVDHNSDDPGDWSGRAIDMRRNINPILEEYGVDLVLSGHSHGYERSYLIDGHYGFSNSLTSEMILDGSSGNLNDTGPYFKPLSLTPHNGTVYLVCGNSGKVGSLDDDGPLPGKHPAMYETNTDFAGSVIIDISQDTLEGKFLNELGNIQDYFHIVKDNSNAVPEVTIKPQFELFPNPATEKVNIKLNPDALWTDGALEFYTTDGRLVKLLSLNNIGSGLNNMPIDISDLPAGIYTIKLLKNQIHVESKLLIVK